jgi:hypothetical protein
MFIISLVNRNRSLNEIKEVEGLFKRLPLNLNLFTEEFSWLDHLKFKVSVLVDANV